MFYNIENHARAHIAVIAAKRALREAEDDLREHERHPRSPGTSQRPQTVIVDGTHAVTLNHKHIQEWDYIIGEAVPSDAPTA